MEVRTVGSTEPGVSPVPGTTGSGTGAQENSPGIASASFAPLQRMPHVGSNPKLDGLDKVEQASGAGAASPGSDGGDGGGDTSGFGALVEDEVIMRLDMSSDFTFFYNYERTDLGKRTGTMTLHGQKMARKIGNGLALIKVSHRATHRWVVHLSPLWASHPVPQSIRLPPPHRRLTPDHTRLRPIHP